MGETASCIEGTVDRCGRLLSFYRKYRVPLLVTLVTVVFFLPTLLLMRAYIFADSATYYYPARTFMSSTLRSGHVPLMCRFIYSGFPLFADSESSLFYPLNLLAALFPDLFAFNYSLFAHYLACALFTYLYVRTIRLSKTSAAFAALAFTFFGFTIAHMGHTNIVNTVAWFPLILYLVEKGMRKDSFSWFLWAGVALGVQFLAGFLFMSLVTIVVVFFYAVFYPRESRWTWKGLGRAVGMFAVFLALGAGLGMIQNLPSYKLVGVSTRAGGLSSELYNHNNLPPVQVLSFIFPRYFGGYQDYWGSWGFVETFGYIGLLPLALLPAAFLKKPSWYVRFFSVAGVIALLISFGNAGLLYRAVRLVPGFNVLKDPARFLVLVDFALVVLAAVGLDRLLDRRSFGEWRMKILVWIVTGCAAAAVGGVVLAKLLARQGAIDFFTFTNFRIRSWVFYGPVILIAALLALLWLWREGYFTRGLFAALLMAFLIVEIFTGSYGVNPKVEASSVGREPGFVKSIESDRGLYRVALAKDPLGDLAKYGWQPNMLMPFGVEDARGYTAVEPSRMTAFLKMADRYFSLPAFGLLNTRYFFSNLTDVGGERFDTNRPVYIYGDSGTALWHGSSYRANRLRILSFVKGGGAIPRGASVGTVDVFGRDGTVTLPLRIGVETDSLEQPVAAGGPVTVRFTRTGTSTATTAYLGELDLGGTATIEDVRITAAPGLGTGELAIVAMNLAGSGVTPAEPGAISYNDGEYVVYNNPEEYPRARVVHSVSLYDSEKESRRAVLGGSFQPWSTVALERRTLPGSLAERLEEMAPHLSVEGRDPVLDISMERYRAGANSMTFEIADPSDGVLVFSEAYMPGWTATIDGKPAEIYPAYGALQAIYFPAGRHEVVFSYSSPGLSAGAVVTAVAAAAGLAALLLLWRRKKKRGAPPEEGGPEPGPGAREPALPDPLDGGLSIFFPAYNDEDTIEGLVRKAVEVAGAHTPDFEVIVVDDGSTDGTGAIIDGLAASVPNVRAVHHGENRGYGGALKSGFAEARKSLVFYTDGDGQYDVGELELLLARRMEADVINGYKTGRSDPWHRRLIGSVYGVTVRVLFGTRIRDVDCDFRLMRREALEGLALEADSGAICMEMVKKMQEAGFTFAEVPVSHLPRRSGRSQFFKARNLLETLVDFLSQYWKLEVKRNVLGDRLK